MTIVVKSLKEAGALLSPTESRQLRSGHVILQPGTEVGQHSTGEGEELIVVLEGTAEISGDGAKRTARAPSVVKVPAHTPHNVVNRAKVPLRYVYVYVAAMDGAQPPSHRRRIPHTKIVNRRRAGVSSAQ